MKMIVTHLSPDLDAITSAWLVKRFMPGFADAALAFVPAGSTYENKEPDSNNEIIHVDTGMGKFDHHQTNEYTCATKRVLEYLLKEKYIDVRIREPLKRMAGVVNDIDHFAEVFYPDPNADYYEFGLYQIIEGLHGVVKTDAERAELVFSLLDGTLQVFKNKLRGEEEVKKGLVVYTSWGKSLIMHTDNAEALKIALKEGYVLVARKDKQQGRIRIKTLPKPEYDLTNLYNKIISVDKVGGWFLHVSKNMLLNGSSKNPSLKPSPLSLPKLVEIIKEI